MAQESGRTFEDMQARLEEIADEVSAEDISLDDALALYEEAVKLGLAACDLSETDVETYLAASSAGAADGEAEEAPEAAELAVGAAAPAGAEAVDEQPEA